MKLCGVCIMTHNVPILVEFYEKVLQCKPAGNDVHTSFDDAQLAIWNPGGVKISEYKNMSLMYFVDDADKEYERLINLNIGIEFQSKPEDQPWGVRAFVFYDPDKNEISFLSQLKKHE